MSHRWWQKNPPKKQTLWGFENIFETQLWGVRGFYSLNWKVKADPVDERWNQMYVCATFSLRSWNCKDFPLLLNNPLSKMNGVFLLCPCWWHKEDNNHVYTFFAKRKSLFELVSNRLSQAHRRPDRGWRSAGHSLTVAPLIYAEALKNRSVA